MEGVLEVTVGYAGGEAEWPTYRSIQDHTEAIRVVYDPTVVTYKDVLLSFFNQHSPFAPPYSRQYRSAILYHTEEQKEVAQNLIDEIHTRSGTRKIQTALERATDFYKAEEYHQKYMEKSSFR